MDIYDLLIKLDFEKIDEILEKNNSIKIPKKIVSYFTDNQWNTVLHEVVKTKYIRVAKLLMHKKLINKKNIANNTPLHYAIESGHIKMIKLLLDNDASPFTENIDKVSSILLALNNSKILELFYQNNSKDHNKNNVLHHIVTRSKTINDILIPNQLKNEQNKTNQTPLMIAILKNRKYFGILITKENINLQDKYGNTALHYAYSNDLNGDKIVQELISNGANIMAENKKKKIPYDLSKISFVRRKSLFTNSNDKLDTLSSIRYYKSKGGSEKINKFLIQNKGLINSDDDNELIKHITNLDQIMRTASPNDKRYTGKFYRGVRGEKAKKLLELYSGRKTGKNVIKLYNYSSITDSKKIAEQFTNIQYNTKNTTNNCCIMVFKLHGNIKRIDMRELEKNGFLVNEKENEILLERGVSLRVTSKRRNKYYVEIFK